MNKLKVLIVDDNKDACQILQELISSQDDMEVVGIACNGEEAIQQLLENDIDIMLLDIIMPNLDGLGVLRKLHSIRSTKVMVISSAGEDNITREALTLGADYYLMKPINHSETIYRIRQLMKTSNLSVKEDVHISENTFLETQIRNIFFEIGIPTHVKGYLYLKEGIKIVIEKKQLDMEAKNIYSYIADKIGSKKNRVRRDIQYAIETTWNKSENGFGKYFKFKPSPKEFINEIAKMLNKTEE